MKNFWLFSTIALDWCKLGHIKSAGFCKGYVNFISHPNVSSSPEKYK